VDLIHGLSARYCIRQDARGFIELWALLIALAGAAIAILLSARQRMADRKYRRAALIWTGVLACFILFTGGVALTTFWWCYQSAAASLGMPPSSSATNIDMKICMSLHAVETIDEWILAVVSFIAAIGLIVLGIFRLKNLLRRALIFAGAAVVLVFALANGGLMLFGLAWCQSPRLF
jgi:hypothetical protein